MRITSVRSADFDGQVYNFHCLPNETYFANGVLTHNCYKSSTGDGKNMSLETFVKVFAKVKNDALGQIALGIGSVETNPDLWAIMDHCRANGVIPNITVNGMGVTEEIAEKLASRVGACAVSHYHIDDVCFDAVEKLTRHGLKQCNLHKLLAFQSYEDCFRLIDKVKEDPRLKGVNAIVFLLLKPKGDRNKYTAINGLEDYKRLLIYAQNKGITVGFDSCSGPAALKVLDDSAISQVDPCESGIFSFFVDVDAKAFPCSFSPGTPGWREGIDILSCNDFVKDVWFGQRISEWRKNLLGSSQSCACDKKKHCRSCPIYDITVCREPLYQIRRV